MAAGLYKLGIKYGSDVVVNQIANQVLTRDDIDKLVKDPMVQKAIEDQLGAAALENLLKEQSGSEQPGTEQPGTDQPGTEQPGGQPGAEHPGTETVPNPHQPQTETGSQLAFNTKEEAFEFVLTKFSLSELQGFVKMAEGGITAEEKKQAKSALLARLTPEEYQALKVIALIELQKRPNDIYLN
jgi:hypothetical protein